MTVSKSSLHPARPAAFLLALVGCCAVLSCGAIDAVAAATTASRLPRGAQRIVLKESLGYPWASALLHRPITAARGQLLPGHLTLAAEIGTAAGRPLPFQLSDVVAYPDGSIKSAALWLRSDLPAWAVRSFVLRNQKSRQNLPATDLKMMQRGNVCELSNALTAVRLPAGHWTAPADAANDAIGTALAARLGVTTTKGELAGPLLGVRLASGQWTAASRVLPGATGPKFLGYDTTIEEAGVMRVRAHVVYRFEGGEYGVDVELRQGDPLVRIDEQYQHAGTLSLDLGSGLTPTKFATKASYRGSMQLTPIDYSKPNKVINLEGWDFYLPTRTAVLGLLGGPHDDLLAWVSTSADWLPTPYQQSLGLAVDAAGHLSAGGSLEAGHRHWGLMVGKGTAFPDPGNDLYRWYTQNIFVPLDKVVNWQLEWPGMDDIEFPHTFLSKEELPGIRARLHADPTITAVMEKLQGSDAYWGAMPSVSQEWTPGQKEIYKAYQADYQPRGGIARGISYVTAAYLYFGDKVYLDQLNDRRGVSYEMTPADYLDFFVKCYRDDIGELAANGQMGSMTSSDDQLKRSIALDMLLGSGILTRAEKHDLLVKMAFATYVMHDGIWQPPVHMPDGSRPEGYGQGTPNQKDCAFTARAIMACMLTNHPQKPAWMRFAMAEVRPHYSYTINNSGALLESPFYSSRDTMRYGPFWAAMTRAGVAEVAPDYKVWMDRPKKAFEYLANMLTPHEPRMGGRRVYHPIGRSSPGVIDPTFMIGGDPWGQDDPQHAALMRWAWEQQGKPSPDIMGTTGGRDLSQTLLAFSHPAPPLTTNPLRSRRFAGMGAVLRSNPDSDYESNILWRHDGFCWDLYAVNNGAVYFYGKGAPLLPRFGAYWSEQYGGAWMMELPFGNRVEFDGANNGCFGSTTHFAALGYLADSVGGITDAGDWQRKVLFSKDLDRDDPVYLLVRDDVNRPNTASSLNWWFMTSNVAPDGLKKPGVVPIKISDATWIANLGHNWKEAPHLTGQYHHFPGMTGVDVDLFIATPQAPVITTDAASTGQFPYCVGGSDLFETQELVRIAQPAGAGYLSLLVPRWPNSAAPLYRTIADGGGVAISAPAGQPRREDRLFLSDKAISYHDEVVDFSGRAGFVRHGAGDSLRLMVTAGTISADGVRLQAAASAALLLRGGRLQVFYSGDRNGVHVELPAALADSPSAYTAADWFEALPAAINAKP